MTLCVCKVCKAYLYGHYLTILKFIYSENATRFWDLWPSQNQLYESICLFLERKQNATPYLWGGDNYIELSKFIPFLYLYLPCLAWPLPFCTTLHVSPPCAKQKQYTVHYKGQLISKCFLVSSFEPRTMDA